MRAVHVGREAEQGLIMSLKIKGNVPSFTRHESLTKVIGVYADRVIG